MIKLPTLCLIVYLLMVGCATYSPFSQNPRQENPESNQVTDPYQSYQRALRGRGQQRAELFLQAAVGFTHLEDHDLAWNAFNQIDNTLLIGAQQFEYHLIGASLNIIVGELGQANTHLMQTRPDNIAQQSAWYGQQSQLLAAQGNYASAVAAAMKQHPDQENEQQLNDRIWNWLLQTPPYLLPERLSLSHNRNEQGWWELALAINEGFGAQDQSRAWTAWRQRWRNHSANVMPPTNLLILGTNLTPPRRIALALPLTGPLASAGRSVRDGFISAYLHSNSQDRDLVITVYDSALQTIEETYLEAVVQGAELFVGPLARDQVSELNLIDKPVTVIALNYLAEGIQASDNFFQLGLVVEDEVRELALRLGLDNRKRVAVFHDHTSWSRRAVRQLEKSWNGEALTIKGFDSVQQLTEVVGQVMLINASQERHKKMQTLLREELNFNPRARQDLDAIVAFAQGSKIGALKPALRYHFANHLPVYTTSQTLRTLPVGQYSKINGFHVTEMPWKLNTDPLAHSIKQGFGQLGSSQNSLQALGVDALRLSLQLPVLRHNPGQLVSGSSGILRLDASGKFTRKPEWGVVREGKLQAALTAHKR